MTTVVQSTSTAFNNTGPPTESVSLTGISVGNILVVAIATIASTTTTLSTISGNTSSWVQLLDATDGSGPCVVTVWTAVSMSSSMTVQVTWDNDPKGQLGIFEVSGLSRTSDGSNSATGSGSSLSTGSVTPTKSTDLAIALCASTAGAVTNPTGGGWTTLGNSGATNQGGAISYQVLSSMSAVSATFTGIGFINLAGIQLIRPVAAAQGNMFLAMMQ